VKPGQLVREARSSESTIWNPKSGLPGSLPLSLPWVPLSLPLGPPLSASVSPALCPSGPLFSTQSPSLADPLSVPSTPLSRSVFLYPQESASVLKGGWATTVAPAQVKWTGLLRQGLSGEWQAGGESIQGHHTFLSQGC